MAIWDFADYSYFDLLERLEKMEDMDISEGSQDDDELRELQAEISKREEKGYQYVVFFPAINNDTYEDTDRFVGFYELPEDINEFVKNTYDGVWEPIMDLIQVFELKEIKIPDK